MEIILIIDDDIATLRLIESHLSGLHYRIFTQSSSVKAIEMARTINPDLILLDINMPEMNGFQYLDTLRKDPMTFDIPVIMLTALRDKNTVFEAMKFNIVDYVVKPYDRDKLVSKIKSALTYRNMLNREKAIDSSEKIFVTIDRDKVLMTFRTSLTEKKFIDEAKVVFNPFFFQQLKNKACIVDLRFVQDVDDVGALVFQTIIKFFGSLKVYVVAGRHYGKIATGLEFGENVLLFVSFGDMELHLEKFSGI